MLPSGLLASPSYLWHAHWHLCLRASLPSVRFIAIEVWDLLDYDKKKNTTFQKAPQLLSIQII